jgi:hypothetical protein
MAHTYNPRNKYELILCELHHPTIHGKTHNSDPHIERHYIVYDRFDGITGVSINWLDDYDDNDLSTINILDIIDLLNNYYYRGRHILGNNFPSHPTIRNYTAIATRENYIKPEIAQCIMLPTQELIAILKTTWIRIIQKKWKKVYAQRQIVLNYRRQPTALRKRESSGQWPSYCLLLPGLRGMLSELNTRPLTE